MRHLPLITGSGGRLGRALSEVVETEHAEEFPEAVFATRDELDLGDYWRLRAELERIGPTVVVNCAAFAQVDACETHRDLATLVNTEGARHVARAAREVGAWVIQVSTDLVFDGEAGRPYSEEDEPRPLSHYAVTKLEGERAVAAENPDHTILRSSWFFGPWPADRYPEVFLAMLRQGRSVRMVADRIGSPTYLKDLARALVALVRVRHRGLLHFSNAGTPTSRFHLLAELAGLLGIPTTTLTPLADRDWSDDVAPRPRYSALDHSRFTQVTGIRPRTWNESLKEYVAERDR